MRFAILIMLLMAVAAHAGPLALPAAPRADLVQRLNAQLPLSTVFFDESGGAAPLSRYFDKRPVVLVLGYYQCPNLCSTLMEGVVQAMTAMRLPAHDWRLVEVSIDPSETPALAARKKVSYEPMLGRQGGEMHLLTGTRTAIAQLAQTVGFRYQYDPHTRQFAHPAGFVVATPDGRISRYFPGVQFEPRDVRLALVEAASGHIGSLSDRLLLLCSHYDPATGRYSATVMTLVRIGCLIVLTLLAAWMLLQHLRRGRRP